MSDVKPIRRAPASAGGAGRDRRPGRGRTVRGRGGAAGE